ncbi:MAG: archaeosortase A [Candidatus Thalassarchaeaceae archaeon]|jgi:archaeosortase A (PGF-CTERM-specific)|nr:archaeosortase A [Candidatus Thalassarchaeaceae archaeon]MDP7042571.1 archaeosortase A [Candidatus Thalassarchaeaceae archaeon]
MVAEELRLVFALVGLLFLGFAFHTKIANRAIISAIGWVSITLYFFLDTPHYIELADPVLILMSGATLPLGMMVGYWEIKLEKEEKHEPALLWLKGCVFWSALPYLAVSWIPYLSVGIVWITAVQAVFILRITGMADLQVGTAQVEYVDGTTSMFSEFTGNPWLYLEPLGEGGFFIPILSQDGGPVGVSIILACSALQSMIVFVGALVALQTSPWRMRLRGLFITIPLIHILNVFRNAGIIYLDMAYRDWNWLGMGMFDFAHSYAAKVGSLVAMFLIAIVLFEILPELHKNILRLMDPFIPNKKKINVS